MSFFTSFQNRIQRFLEKDFCHKFSFFNRFTQAPKPLNSQNLLSVTKVLCWGSLNLENLWFYIWVAVVWLVNLTQMNDFTSPWIKNLRVNTIKYILKCWKRSVKRKPNLSFISHKNLFLDQFFLYVYDGYAIPL